MTEAQRELAMRRAFKGIFTRKDREYFAEVSYRRAAEKAAERVKKKER
jgi:hypothetical protein